MTDEYKNVENKLLILYLINRMELSMSSAQITEFIISKDLMHTFTLNETLTTMKDQGLLSTIQENSQDLKATRYSITEDGQQTLELFEEHIPRPVRKLIDQYVTDNRGQVKRDYEVNATYFPNIENNDFQVKCGVYEDRRALLEVSISVDTREQAKLIQNNWNGNASGLYQKIIEAIIS